MARRAAGRGSVYQRSNGTWCATYKVETVAGKKTKSVYAKTEEEVEQKLNAALKEVAKHDNGIVPDAGSMSVASFLDQWYGAHKRNIRITTAKKYESIIRNHLKPAIGTVKLTKLNALHIENLYTNQLEWGVGRRTVEYTHVTLKTAMRQAVRWWLIPTNPTDAVVAPKSRRAEIKTLTRDQAVALLDAAKGDKLEGVYVLALTAGLRIGEILALQWGDIDLEAGTLTVRRSLASGVSIESPKTVAGRRMIRLTRRAVEALKRTHSDCEWVFSTRAGTPHLYQNFHKRSWQPMLQKAGLSETTRPHHLRHGCASLMLEQGVSPVVVSEILGHSDVGFTLRTYVHPSDDGRAKAANAMDEILG
jgi:integrase